MGINQPGGIHSLLNLIPLEELQQIQDSISQINELKSVITDIDGNQLTMPSNESGLCRLISRTPHTYAQCMDNYVTAAEIVRVGRQIYRFQCLPCGVLGIEAAVIPIIINDEHIGNWFVGHQCTQPVSETVVRNMADELGLEADDLIRQLRTPKSVDAAGFEHALTSIQTLIHKITLLGYRNLSSSRAQKKIFILEDELSRFKNSVEEIIHNRTADLLEINQRMQLEVLERDLVEEQIARKSKLLDAINQMLQSTLINLQDHELADLCLQFSLKITDSRFGLIIEYHNTVAKILAKTRDGRQSNAERPKKREITGELEAVKGHSIAYGQEAAYLKRLLREIIQKDGPFILKKSSEPIGVPDDWPKISSLLAVPMHNQKAVSGLILVANKIDDYAVIDIEDIQTLLQAFAGVLYRNRLEQSKNHSEKRLKLALDSANEGLWDFSPDNEDMYFSPRWYTMLGYSMDEFPSTLETWHTLTHPEDVGLLKQTFAQVIDGADVSFRIEIRMLTQSSQWCWLQVRGSAADRDIEGKARRIVGTLNDITKYKQVELALQKANVELQRLAALDELTQIANRRRFDERFLQEWRRARRDHNPLALVLCDIDYFKSYNDTYGHLKGDDALKSVAQALQAVLKRSMDLAARFGGEEFAIILPSTDIEGAISVAEDVKKAVEELQIEHSASNAAPFITCSFGVAALTPVGDKTFKVLIDMADKALYKAKAGGRNLIVPFDEGADIEEPQNKSSA